MSSQIEKVTEEEIDLYLPEDLKEKQLKANKKADKSMKKMLAYIIKWSYTIEAQDNGYCYISDDTMHDAVGMDKNNIPCYAQSLIKVGCLESFQRGTKRIKDQPAIASRYKLVDELMPKVEIIKDCTENHQSYSEKVQSYSEKVQSYSPNSSVLFQENISLIGEKKTENNSLIEEKDCNVIKCNKIELNKMKGKVNMEEYITKSEFKELLSKVEGLVNKVNTLEANNQKLNERLDNAARYIKTIVNGNNQQPAPTKKVESSVPSGNQHYDTINSCIETIKSNNSSYQSKLDAVSQLNELINSGELSDYQVNLCNKWIEPHKSQLEATQQATNLDDKVENFKNMYKLMQTSISNGDYTTINLKGKEYLESLKEIRQLKKDNKFSRETLSKINTSIAIGNNITEGVQEFFDLRASNNLSGTTDQITPENLSEAKKMAEKANADVFFKVREEIEYEADQYINIIKSTNEPWSVNDVRAEFIQGVKTIEGYNDSKHYGLVINAADRVCSFVRMHNVEHSQLKKTA